MPSFALSIPVGSWHPAIPAMVRSVLAQNVPLELAVFDASGDQRVKSALSPLEALATHWHEGPDGGQANAIREGWAATGAKYLGWLNADDLLYPHALERAELALDAGADVFTGQSMFMDKVNSFTGLHPGVRPISDELYRANIISQPSTFVRRTCVEAIGGLNPALHYTMDWDLWVRLREAGMQFQQTDDVLSAVIIEPGTKTSELTMARLRELRRIIARHAGPVTQAKSLIGFWQRNRAEAKEARQEHDRAYARTVAAETGVQSSGGEADKPRAGLPIRGATVWHLANFSNQVVTRARVTSTPTVLEGDIINLPPVAAGKPVEITLSAAPESPTLVRTVELLSEDAP